MLRFYYFKSPGSSGALLCFCFQVSAICFRKQDFKMVLLAKFTILVLTEGASQNTTCSCHGLEAFYMRHLFFVQTLRIEILFSECTICLVETNPDLENPSYIL